MPDRYEILVVGSGEAGKYLAWTMAKAGRRTVLIERRLVGGSCPNIACMPSKNVVHSAKVASYLRRSAEFGAESTDSCRYGRRLSEEAGDGRRPRINQSPPLCGTELVMGQARFIGERTVEVKLNAGGSQTLTGDKVFLSLGTRSVIPDLPGLSEAKPMTHIEALDLQRRPEHLIVLGAEYVALELAQAFRRLGSKVTIIERGEQLMRNEDEHARAALLELFHDEEINLFLNTTVSRVHGVSGSGVELDLAGPPGSSALCGTDLLIATGGVPIHRVSGWKSSGSTWTREGTFK